MEIAILIGSNNSLSICNSKLGDGLFSRLQVFFLVALVRFQNNPRNVMAWKHWVLDRADLDSHVLPICLNDRYVFLTGGVRRVGQQFFPVIYTAGIALILDHDASAVFALIEKHMAFLAFIAV